MCSTPVQSCTCKSWPCNCTNPSQSAFKFGISEICSGNTPVKLLLLTANVSTVKRIIINNQQPAYISSTRHPIFNTCKFIPNRFKWPISDAIDPLKLFMYTSSILRFRSLSMLYIGSRSVRLQFPSSWFPCSLSWASDLLVHKLHQGPCHSNNFRTGQYHWALLTETSHKVELTEGSFHLESKPVERR
jgi:hypothetical protein